MIPRELYALCDKRLRDRYAAIERAEERLREAEARACSVGGKPENAEGGHGGTPSGDGLERKAIRLAEARETLRAALDWDDVIRRLERIYPPETPEGTVARYLYDEGLTQADCCRLMGRERKRIRELKDAYVINCALLAVQAGLARMEAGHVSDLADDG